MATSTREKVSDASAQTNPKVLWLTSSPTPYKLPFFEQLSNRDDLDLHFAFLTWNSATRAWDLNEDQTGLSYEVLPGVNIRSSLRQKSYFRFNPKVREVLARESWNCVVISGYNHPTMLLAILWCVRHKVPFVLQGESHVAKTRSGLKVTAKKRVLYPLLRKASAALATGTLARQYWQEVGIPNDDIFIVGNLPDVEWFKQASIEAADRRTELRQEAGLDERPAAIFVGRLIPVKGFDILLKGLAQLDAQDRPQIVIIGDGTEKNRLQAYTSEHQLPVTFLGFRQKQELPAFYTACDAFVLPSREEPWGVVVNEAAACGLPLYLSGKVGAAPDMIAEGENGRIVSPNTPENWATALREFRHTSSDKRLQMGRKSVEIASGWTYRESERDFMGAIRTACATDS